MTTDTLPEARRKPRLRGVSHETASYISLVAVVALVATCPNARSMVAAAAFGACLVFLFVVSALYHRIHWEPAARQRMRRLDHAAIFVLIAGGYTPVFALVPSQAGGYGALVAVWIGAALGVLKSVFWVRAPKWVIALLCVGMGWVAFAGVLDRAALLGPGCIILLVASGLVYSVGAIVYALRRPDPIPDVFGYHEVFHALVIVASMLLFGHVALVIRAANARTTSREEAGREEVGEVVCGADLGQHGELQDLVDRFHE